MTWPEAFALVGAIIGIAMIFKFLVGDSTHVTYYTPPTKDEIVRYRSVYDDRPMWHYHETKTTTTTKPKKTMPTSAKKDEPVP